MPAGWFLVTTGLADVPEQQAEGDRRKRWTRDR